MPQYCYVCEDCGRQVTVFRPMADRDKPLRLDSVHCESIDHPDSFCEFARDFLAEQSSVRGDYERPILAQSMAFDAVDLVEHRKRFPDVEVRTDGRIATPVLKSLSQKRRYLLQRGWRDNNSFF